MAGLKATRAPASAVSLKLFALLRTMYRNASMPKYNAKLLATTADGADSIRKSLKGAAPYRFSCFCGNRAASLMRRPYDSPFFSTIFRVLPTGLG